ASHRARHWHLRFDEDREDGALNALREAAHADLFDERRVLGGLKDLVDYLAAYRPDLDRHSLIVSGFDRRGHRRLTIELDDNRRASSCWQEGHARTTRRLSRSEGRHSQIDGNRDGPHGVRHAWYQERRHATNPGGARRGFGLTRVWLETLVPGPLPSQRSP